MARRVLDVFLSSTAKDLAEYRKAVHERLMQTGLFHCVRQEDFGAQNAGAVDFCRKQAQDADMFVGLIGLRRGWEPDGDNEKRSITEMEHDWAREAARPRYLWVAPDDFPVPGNMRESDELHARQMAFRKRIMGGGERIVSQKGFGSPDLLASEIVEQLLVQVVTTDLLDQIRPEAAPPGQAAPSKEEQAPAIAAAVERLAEDKDVDLLALAKNPLGVDTAELEAKLMAREKELEEEAGRTAKKRAEYWRHIGALAFLNDTKKGLDAYQKATDLDPDNANGWRYLGELRFRLGEIKNAQDAFERLLQRGVAGSDKTVESMAWLRLAWISRMSGDRTEQEERIDNALKCAIAADWTEGQARAYRNLSNIYRFKGDLDRSEDVQRKALKLEEQLGSKEGMAACYGNLGSICGTRGDLDRAEDMQLNALKLSEELGSKEGMANAYGNLGVIYRMRGDLDRAEDMQMKSLKLEEELGRKEGMASAYGNLGVIYRKRGDLDRAEDMLLKALALFQELGSKEGMANAYGNLGNIHQNRKDKAKMCECWRKARDLWRAMGLEVRAAEEERWMRLNGCGKE
jgi:tetratricopeptide (TPR) repeat protein